MKGGYPTNNSKKVTPIDQISDFQLYICPLSIYGDI